MPAPKSFTPDAPSSFVADTPDTPGEGHASSPDTPPKPEAPEGFWHSLGATFGATPEAGEANRKDLMAHPVRRSLEILGGPAYQAAKGLYDEFMRTTSEAGQAVDAGREGNPYSAAEHGVYAIPLVGAGIKRGVEQLGPHELVNRAELGTALGTAAQAAPALTDSLGGPIARGLAEKAAKVREGVRITAQSLAGAGGRPIKAAVTKAGETAKTADEAHLADTQEALHETAGRELKHQRDVKTAEDTAAQKSKDQTAKQIADREKSIQDRRTAEEKLTADKLKQGKIGPTQAKLENAWTRLRAGVETARENALKTGNEKYNGVNAALNHYDADPEFMPNAVTDALEQIKGTSTEPTILKDMSRKVQLGEVPTYEDLQGYYSELGSEISKGSLPGDLYHAYDTIHEAIGTEMQRIADAHGQGPQLSAARNYWRLMKQTFGKPLSMTDVATKTLHAAAPDVASGAELANRVRLFGAFDPDIPKLFNHVENIQKGVESLPKSTPERVLTEKANLPPVPARGRPVTVPPEPVAAPERVPVPDRPEQTTVNTRELRENLIDKWATGESSLNKWQVRALLSGGLSAIVDGLGFLGGHAPGIGSMALEAGGTAAYTFGPAMVAKMLEKPGFREWITRPPAGELETFQKLPNADRIRIEDGLKQAVQQAQKQGIKVDPTLAALVGAVALPKGRVTQQLEKAVSDARNSQSSQ